jgi:putative RNA 2'-phosphotransferase
MSSTIKILEYWQSDLTSAETGVSYVGGMNDKNIKKKSIRLTWLLRHGANETNLAMDTAGFARISDVLRLAHLDRATLDAVAAENNKARYEIRGDVIRAVQGHSFEGTPVTLEGLEASWERVDGDGIVFHGTSLASAQAILTGGGIHAAARSHVHLAPSTSSVVGKRAAVDVLLSVSLEKMRTRHCIVYRAGNGVLLARTVPVEAIVDVLGAGRTRGNDVDALKATCRRASSAGSLATP